MSVSDAAGNPAAFTQTLTVDTVVAGRRDHRRGDGDDERHSTRPSAGTSDAAPGTTVTVTIAGQTMTTLLQANGTWNATPAVVGEGTWPVVASAPDPAGNVGRAGQTLTIGTTGTTAATLVGSSTVAPGGRRRVKGASLSIGTRVTAPAAGAVTATATGTVRIKGVKRAFRLTTATAKIAAGKTVTLKLKPRTKAALKRIKQAVAQGRKATARITVKLVDKAGNTRSVKRTVKLTR